MSRATIELDTYARAGAARFARALALGSRLEYFALIVVEPEVLEPFIETLVEAARAQGVVSERRFEWCGSEDMLREVERLVGLASAQRELLIFDFADVATSQHDDLLAFARGLNRRRDTLAARRSGALALVLPSWAEPSFAAAAPDLWSIVSSIALSRSEEALVKLWQGGDAYAGDELLRRYGSIARAQLAGKVPAGDLEDLVQDTLVRFMRALLEAHPDRARMLLAVIARRSVADYFRGRELEPIPVDPSTLSFEDSGGPSIARSVGLNEHLARLAHALETELSLRQRSVIEMIFFDNLSVAEVAERLGVSPNTVRHTLHRARRKLMEYFGEDYMDLPR